MQSLLQHTPAVSTQHAVLHIQCCNSSLVAACRDRKLCAGGKRPLTLPVQANGIASYFPTLPSNGQASKQFSAPRPASRAAPSQPPIRHSCLGKRSNADAAQTDELQPTTSGEQAQWSDAMHYWQFDCKPTSRRHLTAHILPHLGDGILADANLRSPQRNKCTCGAWCPLHMLATPGIQTVASTTLLPATLLTKWQALFSFSGNLFQNSVCWPNTLYGNFAVVHHL